MLTLRHQKGLSLVELMIAIAGGLFLMLGLVTFLSNNLKFNADSAKSVRLSQELRSTMDLMVGDIRRAGSWGTPELGIGTTPIANPFGTIDTATAGCILFSYDQNLNGTLNTAAPDERFGFLLDSGAVKMRNGSGTYSCASSAEWEAITDTNAITITELTFAPTSTAAVNNTHVTVRDITIKLTGRLKNDATVVQTLTETVRVRNDLYT